MIAALETYEDDGIQKLAACPEIHAVVLGDLFCNGRMFEYGSAELSDRVRQCHEAGLLVYYQTPCYMTDQVLEETWQRIRCWEKKGWLYGVLLQDVGLLHRLGQSQTKLHLIWSFMGIARNRAENRLNFEFLRSLAPVWIATDNPGHYALFQKHGIDSILQDGCITYSTVNRHCYYTYESQSYGEECHRACLKGDLKMVNERFHMEMTVDGHLLGKKYRYRELAEKPALLYAQNAEECIKRINTYREQEKE